MRRLKLRLGFTLLEMSVVLVIIAVIMGGGMATFTASLQKRQAQETQGKLQAIQTALYNFRLTNDRVPCPADVTLAITDTNFGIEGATQGTCRGGTPAATFSSGYSVEGMVPTATLRLPDDYAFDGWGRRLMYAVDKRFTASKAFITKNISSGGSLYMNYAGTIGIPAAGNAETYVQTDTTTEGSWVGVYGIDGYAIEADTTSYPSYATVSITGNNTYTWASSTSDIRGLQKASNTSDRIAACWYKNNANYTFDVNLTDGYQHLVALYALDWDGGNTRTDLINVLDASNNSVLYTNMFSSFSNGQYIQVQISRHVKITIYGPSAVISGIFFDNPSSYSSGPVYVMTSFGPNGHGAYPRSGGATRISSGSTNTDELNNCDCNSSGVTTSFDGAFIQKMATQDPATPNHTNDFDDIVVYATRSQLASPSE